MEHSTNSIQSIPQRYEFEGIELEDKGSSLTAHFHHIVIGEIKVGGMFNWGNQWTNITSTAKGNNTQLKGMSFYVSANDIKQVQERAIKLDSELTKLLETDFNGMDSSSLARQNIDSFLTENGLNLDLLRKLEDEIGMMKETDPHTAKEVVALIEKTRQFQELLKEQEDSESKDFILYRLYRHETRALAVLQAIPGYSEIVPDFQLPVAPQLLKSASCAKGAAYTVNESDDYTMGEVRGLLKQGIIPALFYEDAKQKLRAKLQNEAFTSNKEFEKEGVDIEDLITKADGCIDVALVDSEIGLAILSDGTGHFRPENQPFIEKIWTDFMKNFREEVQKKKFNNLDEAKRFLGQRVDHLNRVFSERPEAGAATLSLVWIVKTSEDKKEALMLSIGDSLIVHLKPKRDDLPPTYSLIQPGGQGNEFSSGNSVQAKIISKQVYPGETICLLSDGVYGNFINSKQLVTFLENHDGDAQTLAQRKLEIIQSKTLQFKEKEEYEERESEIVDSHSLKFRETEEDFPHDDLSLIIIGI